MSTDQLIITLWKGLRVATGGQQLALTWEGLCAWLSPCPLTALGIDALS